MSALETISGKSVLTYIVHTKTGHKRVERRPQTHKPLPKLARKQRTLQALALVRRRK